MTEGDKDMNQYLKLPGVLIAIFMPLLFASTTIAQTGERTMMNNGMMGGGWMMFACVLLGLLLFIALILSILALLKYLRGK